MKSRRCSTDRTRSSASGNLLDFAFEHHLDEERQRVTGRAFPNRRNDLAVGELDQEEGPQRMGAWFEERGGGRDVVFRPVVGSQPVLGVFRIGRLQGQCFEQIVLSQRCEPLRYALASDERLTTSENEGALAANLSDELAHLTPREVVPVRISELVETVDGEGYESIAHQHGKLIESHGQPQPLQAERDEVLEEREYASPALHVEDEGAARSEESAGARGGKRFDELCLSDPGRAVDQHDPD